MFHIYQFQQAFPSKQKHSATKKSATIKKPGHIKIQLPGKNVPANLLVSC